MLPPETSHDSRRRFLKIAGGGALAAGVVAGSPWSLGTARAAGPGEGGSDFAALRAAWRDLYLGVGFDAEAEPFAAKLTSLGETASGFLESLAPASGSLCPDLNYDDPDPNTDTESFGYSSRMNESFNRLRTMAEAHAQPGTGLTGDPATRDAVIAGLDHLCAEVFGPDHDQFGNWWNFEIGSPQALMDTAVLLFEELTDTQRSTYCAAVDHYLPDSIVEDYTGTSTGANRVDLCRGIILSGIVGENAARLVVGRDALSPVFPYVTTGDGYYADGSFIQHTNVPYIGGYGAVLVDGLGRLFALLAGSTWEVTDPGQQLFLDTIDMAIAPFIYNGLMMDCVSGRGISRETGSDHERGHPLIGSVALIAKGVDAEQALRWRSMIKGWVERDTYDDVLNSRRSLMQLANLQEVISDDTITASPEPVEHRVFHQMDRATHRREGWAAAFSMASERITHYETGNVENLRGWHTGSGWLQWWTEDTVGQYADAYWPTVDPYRLPGTTVSTKPLADAAGGTWGKPAPKTRWVGGTSDGEFGALGQHLEGLTSTMTAHKSWFSLDDMIVCLGAGIASTDGVPVETVIENRAIGGDTDATFVVDGAVQSASPGWSETFDEISWAHLGGHAGYIFPAGGVVTALRDERTGAWHDINAGGSTTPITRPYLTMITDHGTDPVDGAYAYLLLPGASRRDTERTAAGIGGDLQILANTADQQGIVARRLRLTAINFWQPGTLGPVSATAGASVLIREHRDGTATICIADPAREATDLEVTWDRAVSSVTDQPETVTSVETGERLTIRFGDLSSQAGATQQITVALS